MVDVSSERVLSSDAHIAIEITEGEGPAVIWLGGFRSDMTGGKAMAVSDWGMRNGRKVVRFDYRGHGASEGDFKDYTISDWLDDARLVLSRYGGQSAVAVGSSMGGWIGLLLARDRAAAGIPLGGLVLVAPAADFTERLMWPRLPDNIRAEITDKGIAYLPSDYGDPYPITARLFEDGRQHLLYTDDLIETGCPVHILQGVQDPDVPYGHALELVDRLAADDVVTTLIKDGDHRLSREEDIARLVAAVDRMAARQEP
ncbi:MAG: alpha/beta hydrolase [Pseudomonadota bacterium]